MSRAVLVLGSVSVPDLVWVPEKPRLDNVPVLEAYQEGCSQSWSRTQGRDRDRRQVGEGRKRARCHSCGRVTQQNRDPRHQGVKSPGHV